MEYSSARAQPRPGMIGVLLCLVLSISCTNTSWWTPPAQKTNCDPRTALSTKQRNAFEQAGSTYACLQLSWGQTFNQTQLLKLYADGGLQRLDAPTQPITYQVPTDSNGQTTQHKLFVFSTTVSQTKATQTCNAGMKASAYSCQQTPDNCWLTIAFTKQTGVNPKQLGSCTISISSPGDTKQQEPTDASGPGDLFGPDTHPQEAPHPESLGKDAKAGDNQPETMREAAPETPANEQVGSCQASGQKRICIGPQVIECKDQKKLVTCTHGCHVYRDSAFCKCAGGRSGGERFCKNGSLYICSHSTNKDGTENDVCVGSCKYLGKTFAHKQEFCVNKKRYRCDGNQKRAFYISACYNGCYADAEKAYCSCEKSAKDGEFFCSGGKRFLCQKSTTANGSTQPMACPPGQTCVGSGTCQ